MTGVCYVCGLQVLYVLYFHRHCESDIIKAVSVTEFLLAHPCLSLAVFDSEASPVHGRPPDTAQAGPSTAVDGSSTHGLHLSVLQCSFIAWLMLQLPTGRISCLLTSTVWMYYIQNWHTLLYRCFVFTDQVAALFCEMLATVLKVWRRYVGNWLHQSMLICWRNNRAYLE